MSLQDTLAAGGIAVALLALWAAWIPVRTVRRNDSKEVFRATLASLRADQVLMSRQALADSPSDWHAASIPMLSKPGWVPDKPFDLGELTVEWADVEPVADRAHAAKVLHSLGVVGDDRYSSALTEVAGYGDLFDGTIYRLVDVELTARTKRMVFTESSYFHYLDTTEVLAFEAQRLRGRIFRRGCYRRRLGDPFDFRNRVAGLGVDTLTIRTGLDGTYFFLHRREPKNVVNNAGLIGVVPAGEFTPSDVSSEAVRRDLDVWRNIMREYAEEFLGAEDTQGQGGRWIDYEADFPYGDLNEARRRGLLSVHVVGFGIDPLPWKPELLTVCVFQAEVFDTIFEGMNARNAEGLILTGNGREGLPFTADTVARYCEDRNISPNAQAVLRLAWDSRVALGIAS